MPKFEIGDEVLHRSVLVECEEKWKASVFLVSPELLTSMPKICIVTHIFVETCFGGCQQIMYNVEHASGSAKWSESCLVPAADFSTVFMKYLTQYLDKKDAEKEARQQFRDQALAEHRERVRSQKEKDGDGKS